MAYKSDFFSIFVHIPIMSFELITAIILIILGTAIFIRWIDRRTRPTLYLSLALFSITIAVFIVFTGLFSWFLTWIISGMGAVYSPDLYVFSLPLGYSFVVGYDIFLLLFTIHIFSDKNEKKVIPVAIIGAILIILLFLPTNYWGTNESLGDPVSIRTLTLGLFLVYNMVIYIILTNYAFREAKHADKKVTRRAFQAIGIGQILNILIFIMFLGDAILLLLDPSSPGYSIFVYFAWTFALVATFLFYLGYILPNWFKKIIEKE
ncbi:MAG: hypothetical protein EAX96_16290 [Candidatus Lokiarchaeota archaeon]|nr:hypothetical protein [Candidatus Lokiarchaeota archaeon]